MTLLAMPKIWSASLKFGEINFEIPLKVSDSRDKSRLNKPKLTSFSRPWFATEKHSLHHRIRSLWFSNISPSNATNQIASLKLSKTRRTLVLCSNLEAKMCPKSEEKKSFYQKIWNFPTFNLTLPHWECVDIAVWWNFATKPFPNSRWRCCLRAFESILE